MSCLQTVGKIALWVLFWPVMIPLYLWRKGHRIWSGIFVAALVVVLILVPTLATPAAPTGADPTPATDASMAVLAATATPAQVDTPTPAPTATTEAPPTPLPAVGQDVLVGDVRWKIISAENLGNHIASDNQFIDDANTQGMFIRVRFEIENRSGDTLTYTGIDLVDSQGREFANSADMYLFVPDGESCILENPNPNVPKICNLIFEVAADAQGLKAHLGDLELLGTDEALVNLGL